MSDAAETHFPTAHIRWFLVPADGPAPHDGKPRICCYSDGAPYMHYATLKQRWLPMVAGQGRTEEWRDVPLAIDTSGSTCTNGSEESTDG